MSTVKIKPEKYRQNPELRTKKSDNGIQLVFVPGEDYISELNEIASDVLEQFIHPKTIDELKNNLLEIYEVSDENTFENELQEIIKYFVRQKVLLDY